MSAHVHLNNTAGWTLRRAAAPNLAATSVPRAGRRRRATAAMASPDIPPEFLSLGKTEVAETYEAVPAPTTVRRDAASTAGAPSLDLTVETAPGENVILAVRHPSGALTFHPPEERVVQQRGGRRRGAARRVAPDGPATLRFRVPVRRTLPATGRRGVASEIVGKVVKVIVLKVVDAAVDWALPKLARVWEEKTWKRGNLKEGWLRVTADTLRSGRLEPWQPVAATLAAGPSLLFIHGTFSDAHGGFRELADSDLFARLAAVYGDRIFAFNHFSVSRTPQENAQMLVDALPPDSGDDDGFVFDVVTHSRGGLVLRNLVERPEALGEAGQRFRLGHAVLVASPNEGTPLATPERWEKTLGWFANLLELFPDNPFTTGTAWVAEAIVWLARHASDGLPGIGSMNGRGELIAELQDPPAPPADSYSALVANFAPDGALWQRLLDVGIDGFFNAANDLVVPTEGGWRIDKGGASYVPASRIGCFGAGGNLLPDEPGAVTHISFFKRKETVDFLARALLRQPQGLPTLDAGRGLPRRSAGGVLPFPLSQPPPAILTRALEPLPLPSAPPTPTPAQVERAAAFGVDATAVAHEPLRLTILTPPPEPEDGTDATGDAAAPTASGGAAKRATKPKKRRRIAQILATYGNASELETFRTGGKEDSAGQRMSQIIATHERILAFIDGKPNATLPNDEEMIEFGKTLFQTLFPRNIRSLYDVARSIRGDDRLDIIFTSMIPWIADKPWEFAYDPVRRTFLATEEIYFIRNVLTAIPAAELKARPGPLRILVAAAQPVGAGALSIDDEIRVISRGFEVLTGAGLAEIKVLPRATPADLHAEVMARDYDVLHFIGHGLVDENGCGYLLFEDGHGGEHWVSERTVREILLQRGIRLVFLNACETGRGGRVEFNRGIAQALVAGGMPAVVANQYKVLDQSATSFAQQFYWSLAQGKSIAAAARESRIAVNYSSGEAIDWAVPVIYARNPHGALCSFGNGASARSARELPLPIASADARRRGVSTATRVAVWDMSHAFPGLEEIITRWNQAQSHFEFNLVDLTAPVGTWKAREGEGATTYLFADALARRLKQVPMGLGVDFLFCLTDQPVSGTDENGVEYTDVFAWWWSPPADKAARGPRRQAEKVMVFSSANFSLPPRGELTQRVLTNALVTCLSGFIAQCDSHSRDPRDCPLFNNPDRQIELLGGHQTFDRQCREKLDAKDPEAGEALERLLTVFQPEPTDAVPASPHSQQTRKRSPSRRGAAGKNPKRRRATRRPSATNAAAPQ